LVASEKGFTEGKRSSQVKGSARSWSKARKKKKKEMEGRCHQAPDNMIKSLDPWKELDVKEKSIIKKS